MENDCLHVVFSCVYKCDERVCVSLYCDVCWKYVPIVTLPGEQSLLLVSIRMFPKCWKVELP